MKNSDSQKLLATTIRVLSAEAVEKAKSGHPGMPMGAADMASVLWSEFLRFNPDDPTWANRDRFVLSAGHGCMLLYSLLHLFGFKLPMSELQSFRQWGSKTPGHPEFGMTPGVETTTGPLGQGFGNGVGIALSGKLLAARYSPELFNYRVFGIVSDGDLMEGIASEAASLAGHLGLDNLIYLYDDNHISIGGKTEVCFTENVAARFEAYGWYVEKCDGHDQSAVRECLSRAIKVQGRPKIICARTTIGFGSPHKAGDAEVHGSPLGAEELAKTKVQLGWESSESFFIPPEVRSFCDGIVAKRKEEHRLWREKLVEWSKKEPQKSGLWRAQSEKLIPSGLEADLLKTLGGIKKEATRSLSGKAIQIIAKHIPYFLGGSADLEPSTKTLIKDSPDIQREDFSGNNIRFGVREHAMGALVNGLAYSKCWLPYTATFLVFSDYMRPSVRLAAISHLQSIFIFTHDSFWVGEDGPTHQPIEHLASLRLIPNLRVWRPADGVEVAMSYIDALEHTTGPCAILLTRQDLPLLSRNSGTTPQAVKQGAYLVSGDDSATVTIVASGSEVWVAQEAASILKAKAGVSARVVSMPCRELYEEQPKEYQQGLIPSHHKKISLEAGVTTGWEKVVGADGLKLGIDHYGASAPGGVLAEKFGITPQAVADKILHWLGVS